MNILLVHNFYTFRGGEDFVVEAEKKLLENHGHTIVTYFIESKDIECKSHIEKALMVLNIPFNLDTFYRVKKIIKKSEIDIVHIHNFSPLISPSVFFACKSLKTPWVQTIHNYRYIVPNAFLYPRDIDSKTGELSLQKRSRKCYKNSYILTFLYRIAAKLVIESGVAKNGAGKFQVLTQFAYDIYSPLLGKENLCIKGNFLPEENRKLCVQSEEKGNYCVFMGRLSSENGIELLLETWNNADFKGNLKILGTGPLEDTLQKKYHSNPTIEFMGFVSGKQKYDLIAKATILILPTTFIQPFGLVILEAFFCGTAVLASNFGGPVELITHGETGLLFKSGSSGDLNEKLRWCANHPEELKKMGERGKVFASEHLCEEKNYEQLLSIYTELVALAQNKIL